RARGGRGRSRAAPEDGVQRGREIPRLGVLGEVEEDALATVDVRVELLDEARDGFHLLFARVDDEGVRAPLRHDERSAVGGALIPTRRRLTSGGGGRARRGGWCHR